MQSNAMIVEQLMKSAVLPTVAGAITAYGVSRILPEVTRRGPAAAAGIAVGFSASFLAVAGWDGFPPTRVESWLPFLAILAFILFLAIGGMTQLVRGVGTALLAGGCLWIVLAPITRLFSTGSLMLWIAGTTVCWLLAWLAWESLPANHGPRRELSLAMVVAATGASLISVLDGSALLGQTGGALAAACGGVFLATLIDRRIAVGPHGVATFLTVFFALLLNVYHYAEVSPLAVALVASSVFAVLVLRLPRLRQAGLVLRASAVCLVALAPVAIAIASLMLGGDAGDDYYDY